MDRKQIGSFVVKQIGDEADRILEFIGTDESPDRMGDIIKADGWKFEDYQKNPVFIWAHDYWSIPLGKCLEITRATGSTGTKFKIKFASIEELCSNPDIPSEEAQFADTVYMAYKNGYLSGVSVGFQGLASEQRDDQKDLPSWQRGRVFTSQNLLELSAVVVPANQNALIQARKSMEPEQVKRLEVLFKAHNPKEGVMNPEDVKKMIEDATAPLMIELEALKAMGSVSTVTKSGAKFSAATKASLTKAMEDMQTAIVGLEEHGKCIKGVIGCIKGMMEGDGSEPEGNSTSETKPQIEEDGNVPAAKSLGDFIDLETFVLK